MGRGNLNFGGGQSLGEEESSETEYAGREAEGVVSRYFRKNSVSYFETI